MNGRVALRMRKAASGMAVENQDWRSEYGMIRNKEGTFKKILKDMKAERRRRKNKLPEEKETKGD